MARERIAIFISFSGQGGVERMVTNLTRGLLEAGHPVDMVLAKARGEHLAAIPDGARIVRLGTKHTFTSLWALYRYLRRERPDALLAAKDRAIRVAVLARAMARLRIPLAGRLGTTVSAALEGKSALRKWIWYGGMRRFYHHVDCIVAVSEGVAGDVRTITGLPAERFAVVRNPVVTPELYAQAELRLDHPWFQPGHDVPVIVGAGRLTRQKDFPTLVRAFAALRHQRPARLVILGEGKDRTELEALAREHGVEGEVDLPGFVNNPYPWMQGADLFVLSSRWEGSPNVLTEAMALGTPVVATDCPSGPREILHGGEVAPLVPMGDVTAMAAAMERVLADPPAGGAMTAATADYTQANSARGYLAALGLRAE